MDGKLTYGASLVLGVLALVLFIADAAMIESNRHLQENASQRQAEINKGASVAQLNQNLIQALAEAATGSKDAGARDLLAAQGITIKQNPVENKPTSETK